MHRGNIVAKWTDVNNEEEEILYMILDHGDGPTKGIVDNQVFLNDQPIGNFGAATVQERFGTMDQTVMTGFEKTKLEYQLNISLVDPTPPTVYTFTTPNDFFDDLEYTVMFPNGLRKYHKDGGTHWSKVDFKVEVSEKGLDDWTTVFDSYVLANTAKPIFKLYKVNTLVPGTVVRGKQYELKLTCATGTGERHTNDAYLKSVREVCDVAFTYPGRALTGIKAIATSILNQDIDAKVIREDRIINVFDGTNWELDYCNNRAWVVWDALTQPVIGGAAPYQQSDIKRYDCLDTQYLDLAFFYKWAQFCETDILDGYGGVEPRCPCNHKIEAFTSVFEWAFSMAEVGRAKLYWRGNVLTGWIDDVVTTPKDLVTMDSIMAKTWKNAWAIKDELAGVIEVMYDDEKQGYEHTSAESPSEAVDGYQDIVTVEGVGLNSAGAATHYAYYLSERNRLILNTNSFQVFKEGFRYELGDVIRLQSRPANWGKAFRVTSATADTTTVDRDATMEIDVGDILHIRTYDVVLKKVVTDTYEVKSIVGNVIEVTENWAVPPVKGNLVATGPIGAVKERRIIKLEPTVDNYFDVTVETYDKELFDADLIDPANPNAHYTWPGPIPKLNQPLTRVEINDLVNNLVPPQPDTDIPIFSNVTWTGSLGTTVAWTATDPTEPITFRYKGETYEIDEGSTTDEFIYWHAGATTVFSHANLLTSVLAVGGWVMCQNKAGVAYPANATQVLHGGLIQAGTITAAYGQLGALAVQTANINELAVVSSKIGLLAVETANIKNLNVTTLKIDDEATRIYKTPVTDGGMYIHNTGSVIQTQTFTSLGSAVSLRGFATFLNNHATDTLKVRLWIHCVSPSVDLSIGKLWLEKGETDYKQVNALHTPGAGSRTYQLMADNTGPDTIIYATFRGMVIEEWKGK